MIIDDTQSNKFVLTVLYQDEYVCVIHKPPGISFHSTNEAQGIVQLVKQHFSNEHFYPVHRLDKMTSGLMIFAKTSQVNSDLSQQFADKKIEKYYLALSARKPNKKQGVIIGDMQKGRRGSYLLLRKKDNPAVTRFFAKSLISITNERRWFFVLKPETGKTHQLRVALKSIGSAILGDQRYGQDEADRGYLHAYKVRFVLYDKLYDLTDPHFKGQYFELLSDEVQKGLNDFINPEHLKWAKGAFKLDDKCKTANPVL